MSNMSDNNGSGGVGVVSVLGVLFIALKLTGVINWSWVWVLSPWWIALVALTVLFIVVGIAAEFRSNRF